MKKGLNTSNSHAIGMTTVRLYFLLSFNFFATNFEMKIYETKSPEIKKNPFSKANFHKSTFLSKGKSLF